MLQFSRLQNGDHFVLTPMCYWYYGMDHYIDYPFCGHTQSLNE